MQSESQEKAYQKVWRKINKEKIKTYQKTYYKANKERLKTKHKAYVAANREKVRIKTRAYRKTNKEKIKVLQKAWCETNKEKVKVHKKAYYEANKPRTKAINKVYRETNKEKVRVFRKAYCQTHKEELNAYYKAYRQAHKQERLTYAKEYLIKRRLIDPKFRLNSNISTAIWSSLKGNKKGVHWELLVDYTLDRLKKHLEKLFVNGMTWNNYGKDGWVIDHKTPKSVFNFTKPEHRDFKRCWALKNLQPMWAKDNLKKRAKIEEHFQPSLLI